MTDTEIVGTIMSVTNEGEYRFRFADNPFHQVRVDPFVTGCIAFENNSFFVGKKVIFSGWFYGYTDWFLGRDSYCFLATAMGVFKEQADRQKEE